MTEVESPWLTPEQAMAYLGIAHPQTLARYRRKGLQVHYIGAGTRTPRYHRDEIDAWVREQAEVSR